jgi:hypothetical protein
LLLPITTSVYDFRTDVREDSFTVETAAGETTDNVTLVKSVYDDDVTTIGLSSSDSDDSPIYSSYNTTTRLMAFSGLAESTNRTITVSYDVDALNGSSAWGTLLDAAPFIYYVILAALPIAGIAAIWTGKINV